MDVFDAKIKVAGENERKNVSGLADDGSGDIGVSV